MNRIFVNKSLPFKMQDSQTAVLFLFLLLLPFTAILPHAHLSSAVLAVSFFALGILRSGKSPAMERGDVLYSVFLMLTLSGLVLPEARAASALAFSLRLAYFLPLLFKGAKSAACRTLSLFGGAIGALTFFELLLSGGETAYSDASLFPNLSRAVGLFGNPNVTAAYLLPAALCALFLLLFAREGRRISALCFSGAALGIAATYSRGALLALGGASFLLLLKRFGARRLLFTVLSLLPLALLLLPNSLKARLASVLTPDSSVLYRFSLWKSVFRLPARTQLLGVGEGRRAMLTALMPVLSAGLLQVEHTHSLYLHLLLGEGAVGLLLFLILALKALFRKGLSPAKGALLSLLIFGFFDDPLYRGQTEVLLWLTLGLC